MKEGAFSEAEAKALQGHQLRSITKHSLVPPGSRGQVIGMRKLADGTCLVLVNWEVNPAFVTPVPIQAEYSKSEAHLQFQVID